jgi:hypothetical protein
MMAWGALGGIGLGALYGTMVVPLFGTVFGALVGGFVGLVLGVPSGLLVAFITQYFIHTGADLIDYGWTIGIVTAALVLPGSWLLFTQAGFGAAYTHIVGAFIACITASYASKRFADRVIVGDVVIDKPKRKHDEYV